MSDFSNYTNDLNNSMLPEPLSEVERLALELERRASEKQSEDEAEGGISLLTFYLDGECYALPLDAVKVVSRLLDVTPVPGTAAYVLGVINHKSAIYPLLNLHLMLNLEPSLPTRSSRIVILGYDKDTFAVLVDTMTEVREVKERDLQNALRSNQDVSRFVNSEIHLDDQLIGLLSLENILRAVAGEESVA